MRILFYIPSVDKSWGGAMHYAEGLLLSLAQYVAKSGMDICFYVYHNKGVPAILELAEAFPANVRILSDAHIHFPVSYRMYQVLLGLVGKLTPSVRSKTYLERIADVYKIDIIHSPYQSIPCTNGVLELVTQHDVQEFHFPEFFTPEQRIQRAVDNQRNLGRADTVFVSFRHVKEDLLRYFNLPTDKVVVLPLPLQHMWIFDVKLDPLANERFAREFTFPEFFLYPAATWKHKNHAVLIRTIADIRERTGRKVYLYCTGSITDYGKDELIPMVKAAGLEGCIKFLGTISNEQLLWLYKQAYCVIVPSLYEAGSFPVIESIYLDTPVLCSNVTSLPDTIDMPEVIFDPNNHAEIADKMVRMLVDKDFYARCKSHLQSRRDYLSRHEPNEVVIATYNRLLKK